MLLRTAMQASGGNPFAAFKCRKLRSGVATAANESNAPGSISASGKVVPSECTAFKAHSTAQQSTAANDGLTTEPAAGTGPTSAAKRVAKRARSTGSRLKAAPSQSAAAAALLAENVPPKGVPERLGDAPLRLVLVGHNPSDHAWRSGHYYSNPSNWMWRLLKVTGITPPSIQGAQDDERMPAEAGVGFVDVGCGVPGTDSSKFSSAQLQGWSAGFYRRMADHMRRASDAIGCKCGMCGAPAVVAFTGMRQFSELVNQGKRGKEKIKNIPLGPTQLRPPGWPLPPSTEVWVLTSTSGASPMTNATRKAPYQAVADRIAGVPLLRETSNLPCCRVGS